jgi:hypothetical protein
VLTPAQLGTSDPAQWSPWGYPTFDATSWQMSSDSSQSSDQSGASSSDDSGRWRHRWWGGPFGGWGGPTGSPWPWWAGRPLWQISALTGGAWPWAFGPPLFLPPPVPPVPPLGISLFNIGLAQPGFLNPFGRLSAQAVFPGRISAQAVPGLGPFGFFGVFFR